MLDWTPNINTSTTTIRSPSPAGHRKKTSVWMPASRRAMRTIPAIPRHLDVVGSYFWHRKFGATLGLFNLSGSSDATYFGTATGRPDSTWGNVEVDYLPWLNVKLGLQYTAYLKFNGATSNYDGVGRNASDNNLMFGYIWFAY